MFIVFDGIDGAGKSTQIGLTQAWLEKAGWTVNVLCDPGSTLLGIRLRELLLGQHDMSIDMTAEMLMFMAARAQLVNEQIRPLLVAGQIVLCDRFTFSSVVYQGHAGGLDIDTVWQANQIATGGLRADLTLLFDLPAELALSRLKSKPDRMESRGLNYFERVRQGFLSEARRFPVGVEIVNALESPEVIQAQIQSFIQPVRDRRHAR